jgi:outer membrane lipoprotein carrier protein
MRILSKVVFTFVLLLFSFAARAEESQDLLQVLSPIRSLQADFVQTILDNHGKPMQKSEGKLALQRPGQFRWDVKRPVRQLIIANNAKIWIYDPDLEQVVIRPVAQELGKTPAFLLSNVNTAITRDYLVRRKPSQANWEWYSLTPKAKDSLFRVIELGFLNRQIKEMRMQDNLGHHTVIQFHHVQENGSVASSLFRFRVPANVDVIDETH